MGQERGSARIGIVTTDDPHKGLWRDAESLVWALSRHGDQPPVDVTCFSISERDALERDPDAAVAARCPAHSRAGVSARTPLVDWLDGLSALISVEYMMPRVFELALRRGVRVAYVPNLDWAVLDSRAEDTAAWIEAVRGAGVQVWARTPAIGAHLRGLGIDSHVVPWSIPEPVARSRRVRSGGREIRFLMNAGTGGYQNRRGVDIALRAFRAARGKNPALRLTLKTIRPLERYVPPDLFPPGDGVEVIEGFYKRAEIAALYGDCDVVLHPSRWEGFGIALLEALHAGVPVLATDGWPMNELVGRGGLLVRAEPSGMFRLTPRWECDADALAAAMLRVAEDAGLRQQLSCADRDRLEERQLAFVETARRLLLTGDAS